MSGNADHYATLTFILLTFTLAVHQGQGQKRACDLLSRPHPNGICGSMLAQIHENICFLMRRTYPHFFPQKKRSPLLGEENLGGFPLPSLKHVLVSDDGYSVSPAVVGETPFSLRRNSNRISSLKTFGVPEDIPEDQSKNPIRRVLHKRNSRSRSLVCECCYGPCTHRILASYC